MEDADYFRHPANPNVVNAIKNSTDNAFARPAQQLNAQTLLSDDRRHQGYIQAMNRPHDLHPVNEPTPTRPPRNISTLPPFMSRRRSISTTYEEIPANQYDTGYGDMPSSPLRRSVRLVTDWLGNIPQGPVEYAGGSSLYYSLPRNSGTGWRNDATAAEVHVRKPIPELWRPTLYSTDISPTAEASAPAAVAPSHSSRSRHSPHQPTSSNHSPVQHLATPLSDSEPPPYSPPARTSPPTQLVTPRALTNSIGGLDSHRVQNLSPHRQPDNPVQPYKQQQKHYPSYSKTSPHTDPSTHIQQTNGYKQNTPASSSSRPNNTSPHRSTELTPPGNYANLSSMGGSLRRLPQADPVKPSYAQPLKTTPEQNFSSHAPINTVHALHRNGSYNGGLNSTRQTPPARTQVVNPSLYLPHHGDVRNCRALPHTSPSARSIFTPPKTISSPPPVAPKPSNSQQPTSRTHPLISSSYNHVPPRVMQIDMEPLRATMC